MTEETKNSRVPDWVAQANVFLGNQKWDEAIDLVSKMLPALKADADRIEAYQLRAFAYRQKGANALALGDLNRVVELLPNDSVAYNNRGVIYSNKHEYARAIADFTRAIKLSPNGVSAYGGRGGAYLMIGQYDNAIADLQQAIKLDSSIALTHHNLGGAYIEKCEYGLAVASFTRAIELNPAYVESYRSRARAFLSKGEYDNAIADENQAIKLNPSNASAYNGRATIWQKMGKHDLAMADYNKAIELNPGFAIAYNNRGGLYQQQGEYDRAIEDYNRAIELAPDLPTAHAGRGDVYDKKGNYEKADSDWDKGLKFARIQSPEMADDMKQSVEKAKQLRKQKTSELEHAERFKTKRQEHETAQKRSGWMAYVLLGVLFVIYAAVLGPPIYNQVFSCEPSNDIWVILPLVPILLLATSPIIWAVRILIRQKARHFALSENAYANQLMVLILSQAADIHKAELMHKLFDHHDRRGTAQLIVALEKGVKSEGGESTVGQVVVKAARSGLKKQEEE